MELRAYYGKPRLDFARMDGDGLCSSCHPDLPLSALLKVLPRVDGAKDPLAEIPNSVLLLKATANTRIWIDGKGRPILIATPVKHVERLTELTREESVTMWSDLVEGLFEQFPKGQPAFARV